MSSMLPQILMMYISLLHVTSAAHTKVVASLYGTITLQCSFPFIRGPEGLSVVWEKKNGQRMIVHKFMGGQDNFEDQNVNYTGRTALSKEFSRGTVDLTLRDVTYTDEGMYFCRAANKRGHGDKMVDLTIDKLNAKDPMGTITHVNGQKRLKCISVGVFRDPLVRWYDVQGADLTDYGTRNVTVLSDGRKMVESILHVDVEPNKHYFCQVREGRLKMTARAVISDGEPVTVVESKLPE